MLARHSYIVTMNTAMDIQTSPSTLLSQSTEPLLAEALSTPTSMPLPPEAIYSSKEELFTSI